MMEDFSGLALPPLFGGHILEAELEPGGVELGPGEVMLILMIIVMVMVIVMSVKYEINMIYACKVKILFCSCDRHF